MAVKEFWIRARFVWPIGWCGHFDVLMEGQLEVTRLVSYEELTTPELLTALRHSGDLLQGLLGDD